MGVDVLQIRLFVYLQPMEQRRGAGFKMATTQAMFDFVCMEVLITGIACTYIFAIYSLYCSCSRWRSDEEGNPWGGFYLLLAESSADKVAAISF